MADYRHIMTLLLQERSYRQIASVVGCSQRAIARARRVVDEQHFTTASQVDALTGEDIERLFGDGRKSITGQFVAIDIRSEDRWVGEAEETMLTARHG